MDFSKQALTYAFLLLPTLFALVVFLHGINKLTKNEDGSISEVIFGVFLMLLVVATYFMFIR